MSANAMSRSIIMLMLFGAARADATPEQLAQIKDECLPLMRDHSVDYIEVAKAVFAVMGPEWAPSDEWLTRIQAAGS